ARVGSVRRPNLGVDETRDRHQLVGDRVVDGSLERWRRGTKAGKEGGEIEFWSFPRGKPLLEIGRLVVIRRSGEIVGHKQVAAARHEPFEFAEESIDGRVA